MEKKALDFLGGSSVSSQPIACLTAETNARPKEKLNPEGLDSSVENSSLSPVVGRGGTDAATAGPEVDRPGRAESEA